MEDTPNMRQTLKHTSMLDQNLCSLHITQQQQLLIDICSGSVPQSQQQTHDCCQSMEQTDGRTDGRMETQTFYDAYHTLRGPRSKCHEY